MSARAPSRHLSAGDIAVIALVGGLMVIGKTLLRMPLSVPGHAGVLWIAALIIGRTMVRRPWAATMMGVVGGVLVAMLQPSASGLFAVAKYALPGLTLDLLFPLFGGRLDTVLSATVAGAAAHATKVVVDLVIDALAGIPRAVLFAHLGAVTLSHVVFGALGGLAAVLVIAALRRARIPQFTAGEAEAPPGGDAS